MIDVDYDTREMVCLAYRTSRSAGTAEEPALRWALATYLQLYPDHSEDEAYDTVAAILAASPPPD
ncbi:MAG: hypothetical protein GVY09_05200 [Gammaproteobacteria bacterium]|nr:hypothetical protein [Gammaproteobacteria bacterium]